MGKSVTDISMVSAAQRIPTAYLILGKRPSATEIANGLPFVVTPAHVKKVAGLEFRMTNKESLETGLYSFIFNQHNAEERERAADVAVLYDFVTSQHAGASRVDTQALIYTESLSLPQLFSQARGLLQRCQIWYATFFEQDHPVVEGHARFLEAMLLRESEYEILTPSNSSMKCFVPTLFVDI